MKKRILPLLLVLIFCISAAIPAFAVEEVYVLDDVGYLADDQVEELNALAAQYSAQIGVDILFVYTLEEDIITYAESLRIGTQADQVLMVENGESWYCVLFGEAESILDSNDVESFREAYDVEDYYNTGVRAYIEAVAAKVDAENSSDIPTEEPTEVPTEAPTEAPTEKPTQRPESPHPPRLVDDAQILSAAEESDLTAKLDALSEKYQLDVVIVTVESLGSKSPQDYADDYFDEKGYGLGKNRDGVLLLLSMEERDWWISTCGYGITAFTDAGIEYLSKQFLSELGEDHYAAGFRIYADQCDKFLTQAKTGDPFDSHNLPKEPFAVGTCLAISVAIGFLLALVVVTMMKSRLKSVRLQSAAANYVKPGSMTVTQSSECYLYTHVSRERKPEKDSSGSSTHTSSSGQRHGGGGGKF